MNADIKNLPTWKRDIIEEEQNIAARRAYQRIKAIEVETLTLEILRKAVSKDMLSGDIRDEAMATLIMADAR